MRVTKLTKAQVLQVQGALDAGTVDPTITVGKTFVDGYSYYLLDLADKLGGKLGRKIRNHVIQRPVIGGNR